MELRVQMVQQARQVLMAQLDLPAQPGLKVRQVLLEQMEIVYARTLNALKRRLVVDEDA